MFLSHPLVNCCPLVPVYFRGKAHGDDSLEAIQNLISFMNGQPMSVKGGPGRFTAQIDHRGGSKTASPSNSFSSPSAAANQNGSSQPNNQGDSRLIKPSTSDDNAADQFIPKQQSAANVEEI